ncbi:MAG: PEP/pyruvate-binding domain-containing protein, partial [Ornithinibacter sp.]
MTLTVRFGDERVADPALVGGKAAGLGALTRAGLPVPAGFAVTVAALRAVDAASGIVTRLDARVAALPADDVTAAEAVTVEAQQV